MTSRPHLTSEIQEGLERIAGTLGVEYDSSWTDEFLEEYQENYEANAESYPNLEHIDSQRFHQYKNESQSWKTWNDAERSSLFVLAGKDHPKGPGHGWLSPIATNLIKENTSADTPGLSAFHAFGSGLPLDDPPPHDCILHILVQLFESKHAVLRLEQLHDDFSEILKVSEKYAAEMKGGDAATPHGWKILEKTALRFLNIIGQGFKTYIVLSSAELGKSEYGLWLAALLNVALKAEVTVKVLVIAQQNNWPELKVRVQELKYQIFKDLAIVEELAQRQLA